MRRRALLAAVFIFLSAGLALGQQTSYVVVVNEANAADSMAKANLAKIFLKKITRWDSGAKVQPVDQAESRSVRESFTKSVHGRNVHAIKAYWQKMIFSGKATPPLEHDSDSQVVEYVRKHPGAIGYISTGTSIGTGVKVLHVTNN